MWKKKKYKWQLRKLKRIAKKKKKNQNKKSYKGDVKTTRQGKKYKQIPFKAPIKFSLVENPKETYSFFSEITDIVRQDEVKDIVIFIDLLDVEHLTVDAIMYLLAIICNVKNASQRNIFFKGNQPKSKEAHKLLQQSGFFKYVHSASTKIERIANNIQIKSGQSVDSEVVKEITEFVNNKCNTNRKFTLNMYDVLIELMNNTVQHAYDRSEILNERNWYLYAVDKVDKIKIVFLDTGLGIAETVHRDWMEVIKDPFRKDDGYYVKSALKGEFRSQTGEKNRGNGLPTVYEYAKKIEISKFRIYTGKSINKIHSNGSIESKELEKSLYGVLYYWEIKKQKIGKEFML